jgi:two-component system, cell cycle sensor histidine kinase and response regulator CckA
MASILIAEDRAVDRRFLATLLGYQGHGILEASDGAEALALVLSKRPHLVISDVLMPTMDGYEFVRQMRAIPAVAATPVIFYTATYHEREARALAERCGVRDIITKPSESAVILAKVDAVLGRSRMGVNTTPPDAAQFQQNHLQLVNQKLNEKVQSLAETEHRLSALIDIGQRFSHERDPRGVLQQVCTSARDVTLAKHAVLALLSDDGTRLEAVLTSGVDPSRLTDVTVGIPSADVLSQMLERRVPVRRRDVNGATDAQDPARAAPEESSYLGVPIATASGMYGWLSLTHKLGADDFTETDERMAVALAGQAGVAYENARHVSRLEQEVAERTRIQDRMDFTLAAAHMGIGETDLDTGRVLWSDSTAALFGISPDSFAGTAEAFYALVHPEDRVALREAFATAFQSGTRDLTTEFRTIWPDGSTRWLQTRARITYRAEDRPVGLVEVSLDITDRKLLEAQFRQAQKMEAVGLLASGIAHDFNNLLTVICGYSEFLRDGLPPGPQRSDAEEVIRAAGRATALTRQLLAFSRKQVLLPTRLDVNELVANVSTLLKRLLGDHIELTTAFDPMLPAVRADAGQLEQVLINLVVNARDAIAGGGRITIATATVQLDANATIQGVRVKAGAYVVLAVSDTGAGMDQKTKDRLFEPFFTTKAPGKGTGLGLAAVHGIVTQSGGYVAVESEPLHGTSFKVYLPAAEPAGESPTVPESREQPAGGTAFVLIVEDDQPIRMLARSILERAGYRVLDASTAADAEALFDKETGGIDLLVTDVALPDGSGPALFRQLCEKRPSLRVLYMSGHADETLVDGAALGADDGFLQKPFLPDGLVRKVRAVLDR